MGRVVEVTVRSVGQDEVDVVLADGRPGVIARRELGPVAPGETVVGALLARDDPRGRVVLSHSWAVKQRAWAEVEAARDEGRPLGGKVTGAVKGGLVVDVGVRAFLPTSLVGEPAGTDADALVGQQVEVLVVEADRERDRIVVSRKELVRRERRRLEREALSSLEPGSVVRGTVVQVADYGAIVEVHGVRGLVHRSELSWHRVDEVADLVSPGDEVDVVVLEVNRSRRRVSLSMRRTTEDPLAGVEVGDVVPAVVTRVVEYGAFAMLEGGAEGLVHVTELTEVPGLRSDQIVAPGEQITVKVMAVDLERRRLALSVRRVLLDG